MTGLTIVRLGHLGDGIADGPVFVKRALPGEIVEGAIVGGRMAAPRILRPSTDRVRPPCPHYATCGGCGLQHAADQFVAGWKQDVVVQALAAHGIRAPFDPIATSPPGSRRRATLSARRTKKGASVGFHAARSDTITEIPDCRLLDPALIAAIPAIRALAMAGGSRKAELSAALTLSDAGVDASVTGGKSLDRQLETDLAAIAAKHALARLTWDGEPIATFAPPVHRIGRAGVVPPPGAFLQATLPGEAALQSAVCAALEGAGRVADLFAGCGTFALRLAEHAEVHAVEGDAAMLAALEAGWRGASGLKRIATETRDLFRRPLLPDELTHFDGIVIDPPRAGAEAQVTEIAASRIGRVAMVSCNPVSFSRDIARLITAGFTLDRVQVVDQFRWSPHVEIAAGLTRVSGAAI